MRYLVLAAALLMSACQSPPQPLPTETLVTVDISIFRYDVQRLPNAEGIRVKKYPHPLYATAENKKKSGELILRQGEGGVDEKLSRLLAAGISKKAENAPLYPEGPALFFTLPNGECKRTPVSGDANVKPLAGELNEACSKLFD